MNRNALRYFVAVAEQGSLRAAADFLHIAQSALSRQIMNLEDELGVALLERLPRGIELTPAGQIFLRYARDSLAQFDLVKSEVSALQGLHRGTVRVSAPEAFSRLVLPACMESFRSNYPGVEVIARIMQTTQAVVTDVRDVVVDFGIAYSSEIDDDVQVDFEMKTNIVAVMNPDNPLAERESITIADLAGLPLALPIAHSLTGDLIFQTARRAGVRLRPALLSNSVHLRLTLATRTDVIALLADITAADAVKQGLARAVPMTEASFSTGTIRVFTLPRRRLDAAAETFRRLVISELEAMRFG